MFRVLLLGVLPMSAAAAPLDLLVGSYTQPGGSGVYTYRYNPQQGRLEAQPWQSLALDNPSWLVVSPDRRQVYAVNENGPGYADPVGRVSRLELDADHRLSLREQLPSLSDEPTHASLAPDGRHLFVANYAVQDDPGGLLAVLPLDAQGALQPATQVASYQASGVDRERQRSAHVHAAVVAPDGKHVLVADLGGDRVYVYRYDADAARPLRAAEPAFVALPAGSGPRHLAFDRSGRHAYLTLEMSGQVAQLGYVDGRLSLGEISALAEPGFAGGHGGGAIHLSPDGRWLYAVNRGDDNHIAVFAIDPASGRLQRIQRRAVGRQAREFTFSPDGRFLLVAAQGENRIELLARDPATGLLGDSVQQVPVHAPSYLEFLGG
jgi:6-phosphogluconolactonase